MKNGRTKSHVIPSRVPLPPMHRFPLDSLTVPFPPTPFQNLTPPLTKAFGFGHWGLKTSPRLVVPSPENPDPPGPIGLGFRKLQVSWWAFFVYKATAPLIPFLFFLIFSKTTPPSARKEGKHPTKNPTPILLAPESPPPPRCTGP